MAILHLKTQISVHLRFYPSMRVYLSSRARYYHRPCPGLAHNDSPMRTACESVAALLLHLSRRNIAIAWRLKKLRQRTQSPPQSRGLLVSMRDPQDDRLIEMFPENLQPYGQILLGLAARNRDPRNACQICRHGIDVR